MSVEGYVADVVCFVFFREGLFIHPRLIFKLTILSLLAPKYLQFRSSPARLANKAKALLKICHSRHSRIAQDDLSLFGGLSVLLSDCDYRLKL